MNTKNNFSHPSFLNRIHKLNEHSLNKNGETVIYYMQASARTNFNHALECAVVKANELQQPLVVAFFVTEFPEANERAYAFLLEGLQDVKNELAKRNIPFFVYHNNVKNMLDFFSLASIVFTDKGYLSIEREWKNNLAKSLTVPVIEVESNAIVPVEVASLKEEYGAYTLRPKLNKQLEIYLKEVLEEDYLVKKPLPIFINHFKQFELNLENITETLETLPIDHSVKKSNCFTGGETSANKVLDEFLNFKLTDYVGDHNDPSKNASSNLSPYLHFGHISPLEIYLKVLKSGINNIDAFLEQLFVRRELSINFVYYNKNYAHYTSLPTWAKKTLEDHAHDQKETLCSIDELEQAKTADPFWNAAQQELLITGKMHNYMRMYWGKRLLEWLPTPMEAYDACVYLNNKFALDGRDPNAFAGVAWCFGKHDRPWFERPIFGQVRYMNANGLKTKFNMHAYLEKINNLTF